MKSKDFPANSLEVSGPRTSEFKGMNEKEKFSLVVLSNAFSLINSHLCKIDYVLFVVAFPF